MLSNIYTYINQSIHNIFNNDKIIFLSKKETADFIASDNDNYISSLSTIDLKARKTFSKEYYLTKSKDSAINFKTDEKNKLLQVIKKADNFLSEIKSKLIDINLLNYIPWKFGLTYGATYEYGLAHTRGDIIFLTPYIIKADFDKLVETLIHEKIHLYQRLYKYKYNISLYNLGYRIHSNRKEYPLIRANPDLDEYVYTDPNGNIMLGVYTSENPINILDIVINRDNIYEHPNEEIAYSIAKKYKDTSIQ